MPVEARAMVRRYAFTFGVVGLATAVAIMLATWRDITAPLAVLFVAVLLALIVGGQGQGIIAAVFACVIDIAWVYQTSKHFEPEDIFNLVVFSVAAALACAMIPHWRMILMGGTKPTDPTVDLLRTAIATAGEAVAVLTDNGAIVTANPTFAKIMGQADETMATRTILDAVFPPDRPMVDDALRRSRETGGDELEARILWRDAAPADARLIFVRYGTQDNSRSGHYCFLRTLSRRKKDEPATQETPDPFRDAFRNSSIGMAVLATDGRFLEVNRAACVLTGFLEEELKIRDLQSLSHPDDRKADLDLLRQLREGKIPRYELTRRVMGPKGDSVVVLLSLAMVRSLRGKPLYYIAQMQDIAALRQQASAGAGRPGEAEPAQVRSHA